MPKAPHAIRQEALRLVSQGHSRASAGLRVGVNPDTVRTWARREGYVSTAPTGRSSEPYPRATALMDALSDTWGCDEYIRSTWTEALRHEA